MLDKLLSTVFDFAKTPRGIMTLLSALGGAAERRRDTPPTGGGVAYGMSGPRRLQQVSDLGRYQDVVRFDDGGPTITLDSPLLYGLAQGPYGPLLAYDIGPKGRPQVSTPAPDTQRETAATQGYVTGQEGPGMDATPGTGGVPGQGVSSLAQSLGLGLMAYGSNPLMPFGVPAGIIGKAIADQQIGAMGKAQSEMENMLNVPGITVISDENGNIIGISTPESIAAADIANFGTSQSAGEEAVSIGMADIAESGAAGADSTGPAVGDGLGWAEGGSVFPMQHGGFVVTKDAVEGAGGPRGIVQLLPQARMIGGPPDPTGKRDLTPARIYGPNGTTPARVSRGEAYVPPDGVDAAGGTRALYALMHKLERNA